jgi:gluconate 2-dehydrogenase gamma chain
MTTESVQSTDTFFNDPQRKTVEAAMARIIPTDDTRGAIEAGTIDFLDRYLSGIDYIYAKPTRWQRL